MPTLQTTYLMNRGLYSNVGQEGSSSKTGIEGPVRVWVGSGRIQPSSYPPEASLWRKWASVKAGMAKMDTERKVTRREVSVDPRACDVRRATSKGLHL